MTIAKTQGEFARAWIAEVNHLIGFYPIDSDYSEFKEAQQTIKQLIVRKAQTLKMPVGDIDQLVKEAYDL